MSNSDILKVLEEIVQDVLDVENKEFFTLAIDSKIEDYDEWDSLAHINIITQIEAVYKIRFSLDDVESFVTILDIISAINSRM